MAQRLVTINLADDAAPLARCRGRSFQRFGLLRTSLLLENLSIQMQEAKEEEMRDLLTHSASHLEEF